MSHKDPVKAYEYWKAYHQEHKRSKYNEILPDLNKIIGKNSKDRIFSI